MIRTSELNGGIKNTTVVSCYAAVPISEGAPTNFSINWCEI